MKKICFKFIAVFAVISCFCCYAEVKIAMPSSMSLTKEQVERQEKYLQAEQFTKIASDAYLNKDYEKSKNYYLKAISILNQYPLNDDSYNKKLTQLKDGLAMVYAAWAENVLLNADKLLDEGKLDEAMQQAKLSAEINPKIKYKADMIVNKLEEKKRFVKYKSLSDEKTILPEKEDKTMKIDLLYEQGKRLYNQKVYSAAKEKFEQILVIDPYNLSAIQYLKMINKAIYEAGEQREEVSHLQRQAEIKEKQNLPLRISSSEIGERADFAEGKAIEKKEDILPLKDKIDNMIIKNIAFQDVPISTALQYLKQESKRLDPSGKGINFFLTIRERQEKPEDNSKKNPDSWDTSPTAKQLPDKIDNAGGKHLITMALDNVPLSKAIDYVCKAAGLKYRFNNYAIEIASQDVSFDDLETRIFPVERSIFEKYIANDKATDLKQYFTERGVVFPEGSTALYDPKISKLIVRNTQNGIEQIKNILAKLENTLPQVSINAKFVEMMQKDFDELGFEWQTSRIEGGGTTPDPNSSKTQWAPSQSPNRFANNTNINNAGFIDDKAFGFKYANAGMNVEATIHALNRNTNATLLSSPEVITLSGHKAVIKLQTDRYFPTKWDDPQTGQIGTGTTTNQDAYYIIPSTPVLSSDDPTPIGVILSVTPFVSSDMYTIDLLLEPQVQTFTGWTDYSYSRTTDVDSTRDLLYYVKMPIISARTVQTQVRAYDGETIVLGGTLADSTVKIDDRTPILGDIPLVGSFFRSQVDSQDKTNLLVFTTVRLIKPDGTSYRPPKLEGIPQFNDL